MVTVTTVGLVRSTPYVRQERTALTVEKQMRPLAPLCSRASPIALHPAHYHQQQPLRV